MACPSWSEMALAGLEMARLINRPGKVLPASTALNQSVVAAGSVAPSAAAAHHEDAGWEDALQTPGARAS